MITDELHAKGWMLGWADAERFARGTRRDRREVRRRYRISQESSASFWQGYWDCFSGRAGDFASAIRDGRLPRTCRPGLIDYVLSHG